jgi:hypothetical protein
MTPEERLRRALQEHTSHVEPHPDGLARIEEKLMTEPTRTDDSRSRRGMTLAAAGLAAAVLLVVGFFALRGDDDGGDTLDVVDEPEETTTTEAEEPDDTTPDDGTTTEPDTTTTEAETTTTEADGTPDPTAPPPPTPVDPASVVFPDPFTSQRFDDPVNLARAFAVDVAGMEDPVVGELMQGDARSGEVEVRPRQDGPPSTVLVRQMDDDAWFVIAAVNDEIRLEEPENGGEVGNPVQLRGEARAFEGTVLVSVLADGAGVVGEGFVTGGGSEILPFEGEIDVDLPDDATHGIVLLYTDSAEDGSVWSFMAVRVVFAGGT